MSGLPWFPFFPKDWLTGQGTLAMTAEQQGAYINLLAHSWQMEPPCTLPDGDVALAKLANVPLARWRRIGGLVRDQFEAVPDGLRHAKLFALWVEANEGKAARNARVQRHRKALRNAHVPVTGHVNSVTVYADVTQQKAETEPDTEPPPPRARETPDVPDPVGIALGPALTEQFCDRLRQADVRVNAFTAEAAAALDGMHGPPITPDELRTAITDFLANNATPNLRLFRRYLSGAKPLPPMTPRNGTHTHNKPPLKPSVQIPDYGEGTQEVVPWRK